MKQDELLVWLENSFTDRQLDNQEKYDLTVQAQTFDTELKRFARNRAFDLVRDALGADSANNLAGLRWLEQVLKSLDSTEKNAIVAAAYFSPGTECRGAILDALHQARNSVDICVFTLSDDRITDAVLAVHQRKIAVRIITDNDKANDEGSDIAFLQGKGVPVRIDRSPYHMHHKFAVIDGRILLNGSFNWTRSASELNEENLTLTSESSLVSAFIQQFEVLWERFR